MTTPKKRYPNVDLIRGMAIFLMFVYHTFWNLNYFELVYFKVASDQVWVWFARFIAGVIIFVMGVCVVISTLNNKKPQINRQRLLVLFLSAGITSLVTFLIIPKGFIFFGILHHIALTSLFLPFFLKLPTPIILLLIPVGMMTAIIEKSSAFDNPLLWWIGFSSSKIISVDFVPIFPWITLSIIGIAFGNWELKRANSVLKMDWKPARKFKAIQFLGRNSLILYLIHQPVFFGIFFLSKHFLVN